MFLKAQLAKLVLGTLVLAFSLPGQAVPVHWTFEDVVLEDVGVSGSDPISNLTGSFIYDANTATFPEFSIVTDGSDAYLPLDFTGGNIVGQGPDSVGLVAASGPPDLTGEPTLLLVFAEALTNAGGTVLLDLPSLPGNVFATQIANCSDAICSGGSGPPGAWAISGQITGQVVPLPAAAWLFGSSLGLFGWLRRKATCSA